MTSVKIATPRPLSATGGSTFELVTQCTVSGLDVSAHTGGEHLAKTLPGLDFLSVSENPVLVNILRDPIPQIRKITLFSIRLAIVT
jgi:hypothetical protein